MIPIKLRKVIEPNLKLHLSKDDRYNLEEFFEEVYVIQEDGKNIVCLTPHPSGDGGLDISLMFLELNGAFYDTGQWSYIKQIGKLL